MSSKKTKLELTWIGKEHRPKLEPRILLEEPDKSNRAKFRVREWPQENAKNAKDSDSLRSSPANNGESSDSKRDLPQENAENTKGSDSLRSLRSFAATNEVGEIFDNMLIRGDNLLGLKALEQEFALTLEEKLASQKQIKAIEGQRNEKRRSLFEAQDAIDRQREELIERIEGQLNQVVDNKSLFILRWLLN